MKLGIDFGTTRTVVAAVQDGRYPLASFDDAGEFKEYVPGIAVVRRGQLLVGWEAARALAAGETDYAIRSIKPQSLAMALGAALLGIGANVLAGRDVLRGLGQPVGTVEAGRFFLVGQLGKYLPGSVWAFVLQMELAKRAGVPRPIGFAGAVITVGIATATSLVVGLLGLPALLAVGGVVPYLVLGLAPIAIVCA